MKITLAEAFMMRNDLKKEITKHSEAASMNLWEEVKLPLNFKDGTKKHPVASITSALDKMSELQTLNESITRANMANNSLLRELETIGAKIALLEQVKNCSQMYPGDKTRNRFWDKTDSASEQFNEMRLLIDPNGVASQLEAFSTRKRAIEKELAHNNFTITI